jgi:hypothetical protein
MTTETGREGTAIRNGLGEAFQANRVPLALIGVGIGWLLASNTGLAERIVQNERVQSAGRRIGDIAEELRIGGNARAESEVGRSAQILGPDGEPVRRASARRNGWVHQAVGVARDAIGSVRDAGSAVLDRASNYTDYAGDAGERVKQAGGQLAQMVRRDPWLLGVIGLLAGALVAALLPSTKLEQEAIGGAREELWNKASELGRQAADRVRELAESTTRASTHPASGA